MKRANAPRWLNVAPGIDLLTRPWSDELEIEAWPRLQRLVEDLQRQINAGGWRSLPDLIKPAGLAAMGVRLYCGAIAQVAVLGWRGPAGGSTAVYNQTVNVTVNSKGGGDAGADKAMAGEVARQVQVSLRALMAQEIINQQRPGGLLAKGF